MSWRRLLLALRNIALVVALVLATGMTAQAIAEHGQRQSHPAPGQLVDIGDGQLIHLRAWGLSNDGPAIILDASGSYFSSAFAWYGWRRSGASWRLTPRRSRRGSPLTMRRYLPIVRAMSRRKPGTLMPLEWEILDVALAMLRSGQANFHGFGLAQSMREHNRTRSLTAHGTLYKALGRLEELRLLTSRWEDAAAVEGRPRRRLYELTKQGVQVAEQAHVGGTDKGTTHSRRPATEPA